MDESRPVWLRDLGSYHCTTLAFLFRALKSVVVFFSSLFPTFLFITWIILFWETLKKVLLPKQECSLQKTLKRQKEAKGKQIKSQIIPDPEKPHLIFYVITSQNIFHKHIFEFILFLPKWVHAACTIFYLLFRKWHEHHLISIYVPMMIFFFNFR